MEKALSNFIIFVFKELTEGATASQCKLLCFLNVCLHEPVQENGALLQVSISSILNDFSELTLQQTFGLWGSLEEEFEH